ncbi:GNAT family N-acetyltransferase [Paenibacillus melissococcoides]|uniref:GNAT family N-acetyltransferase n=1 Tax=Paenibacillus melissococcoides TaxID=2912268 RepID=A0ABM9G4A9_9BACL|nr:MULTISPECIES: GNAT family N-acetyltransferase [Paenibacillus]MEB9895950.1 GNAT family N-acetyltransferase [Bacillus cereus]CAH8246603.1 GNAT family N-acetyltransferase [Paenibacillus melissococcoides]CAH8715232.1 GNAT family N-acetyltransferase [Paenibacillus melissococcoides]CAH8716163.1 GNAT family N-acetyltransferase [Paenibacillus melissococcoides]GIO80065.1 hypothetical protein J6TS7_36750 [Paenibacillus dendritiformis]
MSLQIEEIHPDQKATFLNLYNLYLYELSAYTGEDIQPDGTFELSDTHLYIDRNELHPYFITYDDQLAGYILLCWPPYVPSGIDYSIQELFVLKKYRGKNLASEAVNAVLNRFPGSYSVEQLKNNIAAVRFWKKFYKEQKIDFREREDSIELEGLPGTYDMLSQTFVISKK